MTKTIMLFCFLFSFHFSQAQNMNDVSSAKVAVLVTDMKGKVQQGEEVLFISEKNFKQYSCRTNVSGKALISLAAGDNYIIKLKTLTDTSDYSKIEIPTLEQGQFYTAPFTVEIEFEPPRVFTLDNVHFDTGKPTLRTDSFKELNEIANYMKWREDERYEIAGHTDNVGNDDNNLKLSQARANSVKGYLTTKGIKAMRLTAKGYGETKPVADNNTAEGQQKNRRTELVIL